MQHIIKGFGKAESYTLGEASICYIPGDAPLTFQATLQVKLL